jgi:hypothetical protein
MILVGYIAGERGEAGHHLVVSGEGSIVYRAPIETVLARIFGR